MNPLQQIRERINYQGEFDQLFKDVASSYKIGEFVSYEIIESGYEDVNVKVVTSNGNYFVKIFADRRDEAECLRLINLIKTAIDKEIAHPKFLKRDVGYIFRERYEDFNIRLAVFEYIDGKTFYELGRRPTTAEVKEIILIASQINRITYKPAPLYDAWSILNFPTEFEKARSLLAKKEISAMDTLLKEFMDVDISSLSHSFVHGELLSTNIMKSKEGIYVVDFSSANYYPRIIELAVLMSDILFDPTEEKTVDAQYKLLISEYQKFTVLAKNDIQALPLFIKIAHAMHIIGGTLEKEKKGNKTQENKYVLEIGKKGLELSLKASF